MCSVRRGNHAQRRAFVVSYAEKMLSILMTMACGMPFVLEGHLAAFQQVRATPNCSTECGKHGHVQCRCKGLAACPCGSASFMTRVPRTAHATWRQPTGHSGCLNTASRLARRPCTRPCHTRSPSAARTQRARSSPAQPHASPFIHSSGSTAAAVGQAARTVSCQQHSSDCASGHVIATVIAEHRHACSA